MADPRQDRDLNTRDSSMRSMNWAPPSTLPSPAPQEGKVFRWIRTSMMGQMDPTNTSAKFREGWEPVKAADHPELMMHADPNSRFKDNVEVGGLLLCSAPREMMNQRRDYYARQSQSQIEAVDNSFLKVNDPRMPMDQLGKAIERKSTTSFGRGNK